MANFALPTNAIVRRIENGLFVVGREWTAPAGVAQNDTLEFANVPPNARVLAITANTSVAISSGTVSIGTVATAARFASAITFATAFASAVANLGLGQVLSATDNTLLRLTFTSAAVPAVTDIVRAYALLSLDEFITAAAP